MSETRGADIENLNLARIGSMRAHVWRSEDFPGADMTIKYTLPNVKIDPEAHDLPKAFADEVHIRYAGTLTTQQAARKIQLATEAACRIEHE